MSAFWRNSYQTDNDALESSTSIYEMEYMQQSQDSQNQSSYSILLSKGYPDELHFPLTAHKRPSPHTWALSTKLENNDSIFAIFTPGGVRIWTLGNDETVMEFKIETVPRNKACFIEGDGKISLLVANKGENLVLFPDITQSEILELEITDIPLYMTQFALDMALIVFENRRVSVLTISDLSIEDYQNSPYSSVTRYFPFRQRNLADSVIFSCYNSYIISLSYGYLNIFALESNNLSSIQTIQSIPTKQGRPLYLTYYDDVAFIFINDEANCVFYLCRIINFLDKPSLEKVIEIDDSDDYSGIYAPNPYVCSIFGKNCIHVRVFDDYISPSVIVISKSFDDFIISGYSNGSEIGVLSIRSGLHVLSFISSHEMRCLVSEQVKNIKNALKFYSDGNVERAFGILTAIEADMDAFEAFDQQFAQPDIIPMELIKTFLEQHLEQHINFVDMVNDYIRKSSPSYLTIGQKIICLMTCIDYLTEQENADYSLREAITELDYSKIYLAIETDINTEHYDLLPLLIQIGNNCIDHFYNYQEKYQTELTLVNEIVNLIHLVLHKQIHGLLSVEYFADLCRIYIQVESSEKSENCLLKLIDIDDKLCEKIAIEFRQYRTLATIVHTSQDFTKLKTYYEEIGEDCLIPIINHFVQNNFVADLLEAGNYPEWHKCVEEALSYDNLLSGFNYITEDGESMDKAANLLSHATLEGIQNKEFTLDQAATLLSIAYICTMVNDEGYKYRERIQKKLQILELQKKTDIGGQNVMPTNELLKYFMDKKEQAIALCVYEESYETRNPKENSELLYNILNMSLADVNSSNPVDKTTTYQLLVESRATQNIPLGFENYLKDKKNNTTRLIEIVNKSHNAILSQPYL